MEGTLRNPVLQKVVNVCKRCWSFLDAVGSFAVLLVIAALIMYAYDVAIKKDITNVFPILGTAGTVAAAFFAARSSSAAEKSVRASYIPVIRPTKGIYGIVLKNEGNFTAFNIRVVVDGNIVERTPALAKQENFGLQNLRETDEVTIFYRDVLGYQYRTNFSVGPNKHNIKWDFQQIMSKKH